MEQLQRSQSISCPCQTGAADFSGSSSAVPLQLSLVLDEPCPVTTILNGDKEPNFPNHMLITSFISTSLVAGAKLGCCAMTLTLDSISSTSRERSS